jgi:hypothetical protein
MVFFIMDNCPFSPSHSNPPEKKITLMGENPIGEG